MRRYALALMFVAASSAIAIDFNETEGNNSKAAANAFGGMTGGDRVLGTLFGAAAPDAEDWFRLTMAPKASGIWLSRLQLTLPGGAPVTQHFGNITGLGQTAGVIGTNMEILQTSATTTTTPNMVQWYGFGKSESLFYMVNDDTGENEGDYIATLTQTLISPTVIATQFSGPLTISTVGQTGANQTDTDLWLYDSNFNAIAGAGNDDEPAPGNTLGSTLTRTLANGTYYLAISNFNLANNQAAAADDSFQNGSVTDFPNLILNDSFGGDSGASTGPLDISFTVNGVFQSATKSGAFDVQFFQLTVVPEPGTMAVLGLGALALLRRRKRS